MPEPLSLWGEVWLFWAGGGDEAWEGGFVVWEKDGGVERGVQGGGDYGHWLVRVPPELVLVLGVGGVVRVPPLPMEEVALLRVPPVPTWEVWLTAQQALPFLSSLMT